MKRPSASGIRWNDISRAMATIVVIIGGAALSSRALGRPTDTAFAAEFGMIAPSGAAAFMLLGLGYLLLPAEGEPHVWRRGVAIGAAVLVLGIALALPGPTIGSIALFSLLALALLFLAMRSAHIQGTGQAFAGIALFGALVALIAHAFDLSPQRVIPYVAVSPQGALAFLLVSGAALLARPAAMPMAVLLRDVPSARLARALVIGILLIIPALGWLWLEGEQRGLYGDELGAALMVASSMAVLALFSWAAASHAGETEAHVERLGRLYAALSRTNQTITRFRDRGELLSGVCRTAVEQGGFRFAWIAWTNPEGTALQPAAEAATPEGFIDDCVRQFGETDTLRRVVRERLALQVPVFVNDIESDPLAETRRPNFQRAGVRSVAAIPILVGPRLVALLLVYSEEPDVFEPEEQQLLLEMANDVGFALQHLEHGERHAVTLAALERTESRLASILTSLNSGVWSVDARTGAMLYVNPAFERIFGCTAADLAANPALRFRDVHPEDREKVTAEYYRTLSEAGNAAIEYRLVKPEGEVRWIQERAWAVREADGTSRYDGIATDTTERKRAEEEVRSLNATLERRVAERTAQLENANRELNAFSYSVSHDLRAPLRAIEGFSALLAERAAPKLAPEELGFLQRSRRAVERMSALIDGMLQLARLSTQPLDIERVDISALAREVAEELRAAEPQRNVEWRIAPNLRANADPALLRAVMQNLLGNAWKFTSRVDAAVIEVGAETIDGERVFHVRDNGAGFDMAFTDRLFDAFHRMHGEQEFPGTGIGLATVKRIVSRHGGRIWADSAPARGATFRFTLGAGRA